MLKKVASDRVYSFTYLYNGLGDRIQQSDGTTTTSYTLDLVNGLTQVKLTEGQSMIGTNSYVYGNGRIAQVTGTDTEYFLPDHLGSVRQMVDGSAEVILAQAYSPYGSVTASNGAGTTPYGYTGEHYDTYHKHLFLRSRYYSTDLASLLSYSLANNIDVLTFS